MSRNSLDFEVEFIDLLRIFCFKVLVFHIVVSLFFNRRVMDILDIYNRHNNFGRLFDMDHKVIEPGHIEYNMVVKESHLATPKAMHGGAMAGFMDGVLVVAALSAVEAENKVVSTIEFKINYLSAVFLGDELTGFGIVLRKGKRILLVEGKIYNQKNELVSTATGTFNAYSFEKSDMFE